MMIMNLMSRIFGTSTHEDDVDTPVDRSTGAEDPGSVATVVDADEALSVELGRARRYEHALSIVVASPRVISERDDPDDGGTHDVAERLGIEPRRALSYLTAAGLREVLRTSDIVCYDPADGRFVLGLAESEVDTARRAMARVQELFRNRLRIEVVIGVAQFPIDGLTLDDLIATARARAEEEESGGDRVLSADRLRHRADARATRLTPRRTSPGRSGSVVSADTRAAGGSE